MTLRLRDRLHWCVCGGRVIFLDLQADRYFGLSSAAEEAFLRFVAGDVDIGAADKLRVLVTAGMLIQDTQSAGLSPAPLIKPATGDLIDEPCEAPRLSDLCGILASEALWAHRLRAWPLVKIMESTEARLQQRRRSPPDLNARLCRIMSASAAAALLLRATDRCLVRALTVHATCCRHGIYPKLVFGVRTNPFRAHSWIQLDDRVLVGGFEQVRLFTPVLAVG